MDYYMSVLAKYSLKEYNRCIIQRDKNSQTKVVGMNKIKAVLSITLGLAFYALNLSASLVISGEPGTEGKDFPFTVSSHIYDRNGRCFFVGASSTAVLDTDEKRAQALMAVGSGNESVAALTPEKLKVNNSEEDVDNPLYGAQIKALTAIAGDPLAVTVAEPTVVHLLEHSKSSSRRVFSSDSLQDAAGAVTGGIVSLAALNGSGDDILKSRWYAAVAPNGSTNFGGANSAIVLGRLVKIESDTNKTTYQINFATPAYRLDPTSDAIKIGATDVTISADEPSMHVSDRIKTLYIGLSVTSGGVVGDGALSVALGNSSIVDTSLIEADSIIGTTNLNQTVAAHHVTTMYTSTGLDYLIVVGGVDNDSDITGRMVSALPLMGPGSSSPGKLAHKFSRIAKEFGTTTNILRARYFMDLPTTALLDKDGVESKRLWSRDDADSYKIIVGGNGVLPGTIEEIFVEKDTVFVAIGSDSDREKGGIYYSQALFSKEGSIQGWTDWRRAGGTTEKVFGLALNQNKGIFWFLPGSSATTLTTLKRTEWGNGTQGFDQKLNSLFSDQNSGIQGVFDFDATNTAFDQDVGNAGDRRISVLCATGNKRVALVESGSANNTDLFDAATALSDSFISTDGSLNGFTAPQSSIVIKGGVLDTLGAIISAEIVSNDTYSWLVVGGSGGLAVLAEANGDGWPVGTLQKGFENLSATMRFKKIGSYGHVRKIIADGSKLYVLTTEKMIRIDALGTSFDGEIGDIGTVVASVDALPNHVGNHTAFSDMAVSNKFALLATNGGLLRVGSGRDISTATAANFVGWDVVELPETAGPVSRLFVVSPTHNHNEFASDNRGGNVYVLNAYTGYHQARVYRFSVANTSDVGVTDSTLELFNDYFVRDKKSFYFERGDYRNYFVTDGALLFMSRSRYNPLNRAPFVELIGANQRVSNRDERSRSNTIVTVAGGSVMGPIIQRSALGSWLIGGSTLQVGA